MSAGPTPPVWFITTPSAEVAALRQVERACRSLRDGVVQGHAVAGMRAVDTLSIIRMLTPALEALDKVCELQAAERAAMGPS